MNNYFLFYFFLYYMHFNKFYKNTICNKKTKLNIYFVKLYSLQITCLRHRTHNAGWNTAR